MGASSAPQSRNWALGETTEAVLHACPSSLLIVKKRRGSAPEPSGAALGTSIAYSE
jgi:hypothetical protein